jgi:hypothetical protein
MIPGRTMSRVGSGLVSAASTLKQQQVLLEQVHAHVTSELAARQRKSGGGLKGRAELRDCAPAA